MNYVDEVGCCRAMAGNREIYRQYDVNGCLGIQGVRCAERRRVLGR